MGKSQFLAAALAQIPRILTLQDRNPHSPTYGCFDRGHWHYRTLDFPSGMAQEFVWPLALAYATEAPGNPYAGEPTLRAWIEAGIRFAAHSAHQDGSCDDYFPFERATGAAAFSLLACIEASMLMGEATPKVVAFFERRAHWLARHQESGRLTNHHALVALCFARLADLTGQVQWEEASQARLKQVLAWQSPEGWFWEYEGCDPGYLTLTVSCLARLHERRPTPALESALSSAVALVAHFVHPDGSYGGEYGSRSTYAYFPHGFELVGRWRPEALSLNDRVLEGWSRGLAPCFDDDRLLGHHAWNWLLAYRDYRDERPPVASPAPGRVVLEEAGLVIDRREDLVLMVALHKGGVFKLFKGDRLIASDTQFSLLVRQHGTLKNAVAHLHAPNTVRLEPDRLDVAGTLGWAKHNQMTVPAMIALRLVMVSIGRFWPNLVRRLLQRLLILGKDDAPFSFERTFHWEDDHWVVRDRLRASDWAPVVAAGIGAHQTSIYVAMSRTYQAGQLTPWLDLTPEVRRLAAGRPLECERTFR